MALGVSGWNDWLAYLAFMLVVEVRRELFDKFGLVKWPLDVIIEATGKYIACKAHAQSVEVHYEN